LMGNQKIESVSTVLNEKFKTAKEIARWFRFVPGRAIVPDDHLLWLFLPLRHFEVLQKLLLKCQSPPRNPDGKVFRFVSANLDITLQFIRICDIADRDF
jgi:hypothetical protein